MKKALLILSIFLFSCNEQAKQIEKPQTYHELVEKTFKVVKLTKETSDTKTDYHYKLDLWNGKLRQQPNVYTENRYYIVYTDGTNDEVDFNKFVSASKGDTITFTRTIQIPD